MTRLTDFRKYEITVVGKEKDINLDTLCDKMLHYSWLSPSILSVGSDKYLKSMKILSDKDIDLFFREVDVMEFLQIAEGIAEDDDLILLNLLKHTQTRLGNVINKSYKKDNVMRFREFECQQSLMDFFELVQIKENNIWSEGNITLFREDHGLSENSRTIIEVVGLESYQIDYEVFPKNCSGHGILFHSDNLGSIRKNFQNWNLKKLLIWKIIVVKILVLFSQRVLHEYL